VPSKSKFRRLVLGLAKTHQFLAANNKTNLPRDALSDAPSLPHHSWGVCEVGRLTIIRVLARRFPGFSSVVRAGHGIDQSMMATKNYFKARYVGPSN
jgi:hypothetical protein